jgi:formylglycine-generating enzyme
MNKALSILGAFALVLLPAVAARAITIDMVTVGNAGNLADTTGYGAVGYAYRIGKYEVTAGQYTAFLNAVATSADPYGLYNANMSAAYGCGIQQSSSGGTFAYTVAGDYVNRPVNYVSWGNAARFCNWLANGQPTSGVEGLATTEDGPYYLNGVTNMQALMAVKRKDGATYVIPSENEWYKAAYYDANKNGSGGAGYWLYATMHDVAPGNVYPALGTNAINSANYYRGADTLNGPPYTTEVGSFPDSKSAYDTLDQSGNVGEWTEAVIPVAPPAPLYSHGLRGGSFAASVDRIASTYRGNLYIQGDEDLVIGFRVAYVPEPTGAALLFSALVALIISRKAIANGWHF